MSYQTQLADTKLELEKLRTNYRSSHAIGTYNYEARKAFDEAEKKLKTKISRLESKVILQQGPVLHKDMFGQPFIPGARVVWSDSGRYAGFGNRVWYVSYCTAKQVNLVGDPKQVGERGTSTGPEYLLVVDKLLTPPVIIPTPKEPSVYSVHDNSDFGSYEDLEELLQDYWEYYAQWPEDILTVKVDAWIDTDKKEYRIWYEDVIIWEQNRGTEIV